MINVTVGVLKAGGAVVLALTLLSAGCSSTAPVGSAPPAGAASSATPVAPNALRPTATSGQTNAPATVTLTVAHTGSLSNLPTYIALERGYFTAEGLAVQLEQFRSATDEVAPLGTGQLLIGAGGVSAGLFSAIARGIPLRIVADQAHDPPEFTGTGWVVRKDLLDSGEVKTPKDLRGLTVGIAAPGTTQDPELDVLLRQGGLTPDDVTMKTVGYADQVAALANKSIDVTYNFEPNVTIMKERGIADMWITTGQLIPNHMPTVNIYSPMLVEKYPDAAKKWMVGYLKGVRDATRAYAAPVLSDDIVNIIVKYSTLQDPQLIRKIKLAPINPDGYVYEESLRTDLDYFVRSGQLAQAPNLSEIVDSSFVDYAIGVLGKFER
ncbi:MAG TPA: ABC transporter substrate-binding protein [Chloroflexota bacterium]